MGSKIIKVGQLMVVREFSPTRKTALRFFKNRKLKGVTIVKIVKDGNVTLIFFTKIKKQKKRR